MKIKKGFFCKSCGAEHNQWQGQCRICKEWNTITEEIINKNISKDWKTENLTEPIKPVRMDKIGLKETARFKTGDNEFDSVKTLSAFALGITLFFVTLILNIAALRISRTLGQRYE